MKKYKIYKKGISKSKIAPLFGNFNFNLIPDQKF